MLPDSEKILLLNTLPGMAYRCTVEAPWTLQYVSPGARFVTSIDRDDLVSGRITWASIMHPEDVTQIEAEVLRAVSERRQFALTYRIIDPLRGERWLMERGEAVYDEEGRSAALVGFIADISEQKRVEQQLRDREEHYRAAVELNPQIPWTADAGGTILEVGPRWFELLGEDESKRLGQGWSKALHPDDRERALNIWEHCLSTGERLDMRYRLRLSDGAFRWVRARAAPRVDKQGAILRWYGTLEDIHEQVELENGLRQAEELYALAARATGDVIWDWNIDDGSIRRIASSETVFGYSAEQFAHGSSKAWQALLHPEDVERVSCGIRQIVAGIGDRWSDEYRMRRADGSYAHILDRGYLVRSVSGQSRRMVGAMQDISEQKAAEDRLRRLQADIVHLAHQSALGTMAATIAHELNQPLAASANYLAGIKNVLATLQGAAKSQVENGLQETERQIRRAAQIIKRMRGIVSKKGATREVASLKGMISAIVNLMAASRACPGLKVKTRIAGDADAVCVDPIQIEQVLLNLVRNACDAMSDLAVPEVTIAARKIDPEWVEVEVRDRGRGLSEETLDALFTAFTESTTGGLGVGLSISRTIVEAHGGRISARNNMDGGAVFSFTIPAAT